MSLNYQNYMRLAKTISVAVVPVWLSSCASTTAIKQGNVLGGLVAAPFELAGNVVETATSPLSGRKPEWIEQARVASMKENNPQMDDPKWRAKFDDKLKSGSVYLATFQDNLKAYAHTRNEKYLSRAEQLCSTSGERSELELEVLRGMGKKALYVDLSMDNGSTDTRYREQTDRVLFIPGDVRGATLHPTGAATVRLRNDLPFKVKDSYKVTVKFSCIIPRTSNDNIWGSVRTNSRNAVASNTKTFTLGGSDTARLDFGTMPGAGTVAVLGTRSVIKVDGNPYLTYEVTDVQKY